MVDGDAVRVLFGADDDPVGDESVGMRSYAQAAQESILFSIYIFSGTVGDFWDELEDDIVAAFNAGRKVRGVYERAYATGSTPYEQSGSSGDQMDELGLDVRLDNNGDLDDGLGQDGGGVDGFKGFNVLSFAIQIPVASMESLGGSEPGPCPPAAAG